MLTGGPNYLMMRRAIFGKVHGHGVKEIWLISQFPAKHAGVASGAKIVFARPVLAKLLGCGHGVINNEMIIYIYSLLAPEWLHFAFQRPISYFLTLSNQNLCPWCNTGGEVSLQAESWKTPILYSLYIQNSSSYRGKKGSLKYQHKTSFQISLHVTIWKLLWIRMNDSSLKCGGGGGNSC